MLNSYFTSVHSQHNESLICANIQYICISVDTWKISNNQYSCWNQQRLSPSWLVGDKLFSSHTGHHMGQWGLGRVVHEYSLERGWGHDVGRGQRGSQVGNNFLDNPKVFPSLLCMMDSSSLRHPEFRKIHTKVKLCVV